MKALVKDIDGIGLTLREVEKPTIQANEVLIKIKSTAICGTIYIFGIGILGPVTQLKFQ